MYVNLAFEMLAAFAGLVSSRASVVPSLEPTQQADLIHSLDVWINEGGGLGSDPAVDPDGGLSRKMVYRQGNSKKGNRQPEMRPAVSSNERNALMHLG